MRPDPRQRFLESLRNQQGHATRQAALTYLQESPEAGRWRVVANAARTLAEGDLELKTLRVAILASFSSEFMQDTLQALGLAHGMRILLYSGGFAQYAAEILDPASGLYAFRPDAVILAIEGERLLPELYREGQARPDARLESLTGEVLGEFDTLIQSFRQHSEGLLLIHDLIPPAFRALGILDGRHAPGIAEVITGINAALLARTRQERGVHVVDYSGLVLRAGTEAWFDRRPAMRAKAPIHAPMLPRLAGEYLKYLRAACGLTRKCLVTDLDNTLWGGVIGEDGLEELRLGPDHPGNAYLAYQRTLLQLHSRGILLAIASKNNPEDVEAVFANHPAMLLQLRHFACRQIHWQPKSRSLLAIARELDIALEHLVFVDDNPAELAEVRAALPMVTVIPFPARPEEAVAAILEPGWFDALVLSSEDRHRTALYAQKAQAEALKATSHSLESYLTSLEMVVEIALATSATLARIAQLTQKTNQFNLTTFRHSEEEIARRMEDPSWLVLSVRVTDRFGDNGVVGVMMARLSPDPATLEVETFLLSCRVIGRTIETAMLAELCLHARRRGATRLLGRIIPTAKNLPARQLYQEHGFHRCGPTPIDPSRDASLWELHLTPHQGGIATPPWITLTECRPWNCRSNN
ncbi:MAG: HAD family hydrolase [Magnetococcales bacterium]|nr:HAD family hydrolase [Magnetococcales bacterium]